MHTTPQDDNEIEFFNTIVLQPHLKLVTDAGRGYHVRCRYKSREAAAAPRNASSPEALLDGSNENKSTDSSEIDRRDHGRSLGERSHKKNELPMPGCHMKIYSGKAIAENVKIGDPITLKIHIDKQHIYGLHVMDCIVRDGLGWGEQNLLQYG